MTEAEWLASDDVDEMLEFLRLSGRATYRKCRLFAVACCRHIWDLLPDERCREAVESAERYADGGLSDREMGRLYRAASAVAERFFPVGGLSPAAAARAAADAVRTYPVGSRDWMTMAAAAAAGAAASATSGERPSQVIRLLDVFGPLPFRPVSLDRGWLTPDVLLLARAAYEERSLPAGTLEPDRLALLADALEDAGCDNEEILNHLRGPWPHVRGCWALDILLGKP